MGCPDLTKTEYTGGYCLDGLWDASLLISETPIPSHGGPGFRPTFRSYSLRGKEKVYEFNVNVIGRYVQVYSSRKKHELRLAEVQVFSRKPKSIAWKLLPGKAHDIGVGADGTVWVIGTGKEGGSYGIYRWTGKKWSKVKGGGVRIAVGPRGNACVVNHRGDILCHDGNTWALLPNKASDIGTGANGVAWITGPDGVRSWNGKTWTLHSGGLDNISVGPKGYPWGTKDGKEIFRDKRSVAGR